MKRVFDKQIDQKNKNNPQKNSRDMIAGRFIQIKNPGEMTQGKIAYP